MKFVPKTITRSVGRQILTAKKNSPHIFFGAGIVGVVGGTVMACRATLKLSGTLDDIKNDVDNVKKLSESNVRNGNADYTDSEYQKDMAYVYGKGGARLVRLYAPSVVVGGVSIAALTGAHVSLSRRNAALTAAAAAVAKAYEDYRERVRADLGEEKELRLYHAAEQQQVQIEGKKQIIETADPNKFSPYARFFDEGSVHWHKDPELNKLWVMSQQSYLNNLLQTRGHVFLNEAYDALGIERTTPGQVVGWVFGGDGDSYIDFGIFEARERNRAFVNGWERTILLDFNVDGIIYDKI